MVDGRAPNLSDHVQAIAEVYIEHHRRTMPVCQAVDRMTRFVGRPRFVLLVVSAFAIGFKEMAVAGHYDFEEGMRVED